jgi:hypothetical protein
MPAGKPRRIRHPIPGSWLTLYPMRHLAVWGEVERRVRKRGVRKSDLAMVATILKEILNERRR